MEKKLLSNRLPSKLASVDEVPEASGAQNRSVQEVLEDASTGATKQFATEVEFRKKSDEKFKHQIAFIVEIDKLKTVLRKTRLLHEERFENSAEHSWQLALAAIILSEYCNEEINIAHVTKMLLIHDLVEVYSGDTFHYHKEADKTLLERERQAAKKIFAILPEEQEKELLALWTEFENQLTPEAQFAASIDRLIPMLLNSYSDGTAWKEFSITREQVIDKNQHIKNGSMVLWDFAQELIQDAIKKGNLS